VSWRQGPHLLVVLTPSVCLTPAHLKCKTNIAEFVVLRRATYQQGVSSGSSAAEDTQFEGAIVAFLQAFQAKIEALSRGAFEKGNSSARLVGSRVSEESLGIKGPLRNVHLSPNWHRHVASREGV
jgi:hypothetical protein